MANNYYTNVRSFTPGTIAKGNEVDDKFDAVTAGFDTLQVDTDNSIKLTNADITTSQEIPDAAAARINKVIGFDANGTLTLRTAGAKWTGDWTTTTFYYANDLVRDSTGSISQNSIFICLTNHTSGASMAADAANWELFVDVEEVENWAHLLNATVDGSEYSAKEYAVGTFVPDGSSK